jgi:hypothetical protein
MVPRESDIQTEARLFITDLRRDVVSFCHVQFIRTWSPSPTCTQEQGITHVSEDYEGRISESHFIGHLSRWGSLTKAQILYTLTSSLMAHGLATVDHLRARQKCSLRSHLTQIQLSSSLHLILSRVSSCAFPSQFSL